MQSASVKPGRGKSLVAKAKPPAVSSGLRQAVGAATDARVGEIMVMCRVPNAPRGVASQLLSTYMHEQLRVGDIVYAGATRGETADGRSPTAAWRKLGFTELKTIEVQEGEYVQNVMVYCVPPLTSQPAASSPASAASVDSAGQAATAVAERAAAAKAVAAERAAAEQATAAERAAAEQAATTAAKAVVRAAEKAAQEADASNDAARRATPCNHESIHEMLDLANLRKVGVCGDGNCGFYSVLASAGGLDHPWRTRVGAPSPNDYVSQQALRKECHDWLAKGKGKGLASEQLKKDLQANPPMDSPFSAERIQAILDGKKGPRDEMGSHCNSACMRAAAATNSVHLVVRLG